MRRATEGRGRTARIPQRVAGARRGPDAAATPAPPGEPAVTDPEFYDAAYYASMELRYLNGIHSGRLRAIERILPMLEDKEILDVGCGGGGFTRAYARVSSRVLGVDFADEAIRFARARHPRIAFERLSVFRLSDRFPPRSFDAVVANDVIEHVHDHDDFVENCRSVLRPDGLLVVGTDIEDTPATRHRVVKWFRDAWLPFGANGLRFLMLRLLEFPRDRIRNYRRNHVHTVSHAELLDLLARHGFRIVSIQKYNFLRGAVRDAALSLVRRITGLEMRDHQLIVARKE